MRNHPYDKLKDHKRKNGIFKSPVNQIGNITLYSWRNDCLPEFIWIALILNYYGREDAFLKLSLIFIEIENSSFQFDSLQLSYIFSLDKPNQIKFYNIILKYIDVEVLSPLTIIFNKNQLFKEYFIIESFIVEDKLNVLENIVEYYGTNKSDEATDVQYIILTFYFMRKNIHLTEKTREIGDYLYQYQKTPHVNEEMKKYRPTVRSLFGALQHNIYEHHLEFIRLFWRELFKIGGCELKYGEYSNEFEMDENFIKDIKIEFQKLVIENTTTELEDSKFNVILGSSVYALKVLNELVECNLRNKVLGRLSLRIIIEVYIMLKFIHKKENEEHDLWEKYQEYGIGKYKMILIKARELDDFENSHLNTDLIDALINEQIDEMFLDVDFRYFENINIRNKAKDVDEKELYDLYYDYESNYAHGLWGAIRESAMLKCVNPLHLGHNVPDVQLNHSLADVLPDAIMVFKKLLSFIDDNYPLSYEFLSKYEVKNE